MKHSPPSSPASPPPPKRVAKSSILRLTREISDLQQASDLSLAVSFREDDVRDIRALIIGPPDTPYEFGFFEFNMKFSDRYPTESPKVKCITTNGGTCRFNPNIYADGKVCLSILGTWHGEKGEEWSTAQGLESVLVSIQSLMSSNPFENEPGHEDDKLEKSTAAREYAVKIQHETLRITVIKRLEELLQIQDKSTALGEEHEADMKRQQSLALSAKSGMDWDTYDDVTDDLDDDRPKYDPFGDLYKQRFLWYHDVYAATIDKASVPARINKFFTVVPFEHPGNSMQGKYAYKSLATRLQRVRKALDAEVASWATEGLIAAKEERGVATNFQRQFEQQRNNCKSSLSPIELSLVKNNPLVWNLTFFGKANSDLYGATINVRIHFSVDFPREQPRVFVLTPLFHHRISKTGGVLCYFPHKPESVQDHVETIMAAIEEENPFYDPRTLVNPEAATLLWGDESQKKTYRRKLRRSVEDSMEATDEF